MRDHRARHDAPDVGCINATYREARRVALLVRVTEYALEVGLADLRSKYQDALAVLTAALGHIECFAQPPEQVRSRFFIPGAPVFRGAAQRAPGEVLHPVHKVTLIRSAAKLQRASVGTW